MTSRRLSELILAILEDMQACAPARFDVRRQALFADYQLIAGANSVPHLKAIGETIRLRLKQEGVPCRVADADAESGWIVLDYLDVTVHLLLGELRAHYALEDLWRENAPAPLRKGRTPEANPDIPVSRRSECAESSGSKAQGRRRAAPR